MLNLSSIQLALMGISAMMIAGGIYGLLPMLQHAVHAGPSGTPAGRAMSLPASGGRAPAASRAGIDAVAVDQAIVEELFSDLLSLHTSLEELTAEVRSLRESIAAKPAESAPVSMTARRRAAKAA